MPSALLRSRDRVVKIHVLPCISSRLPRRPMVPLPGDRRGERPCGGSSGASSYWRCVSTGPRRRGRCLWDDTLPSFPKAFLWRTAARLTSGPRLGGGELRRGSRQPLAGPRSTQWEPAATCSPSTSRCSRQGGGRGPADQLCSRWRPVRTSPKSRSGGPGRCALRLAPRSGAPQLGENRLVMRPCPWA